MKCVQLNLKVEQLRKELDKVVIMVFKEEIEKVVVVRQLEESKIKIENFLNWLLNVEEDFEGVWMKYI